MASTARVKKKWLLNYNPVPALNCILCHLGWSLGEHGEWAKYSNFDVATRVPLMFYVPGMTTSSVSQGERVFPYLDPFSHILGLVPQGKFPAFIFCLQGIYVEEKWWCSDTLPAGKAWVSVLDCAFCTNEEEGGERNPWTQTFALVRSALVETARCLC